MKKEKKREKSPNFDAVNEAQGESQEGASAIPFLSIFGNAIPAFFPECCDPWSAQGEGGVAT